VERDGEDVQVKFMEAKSKKLDGIYKWPSDEEVSWIYQKQVLTVLTPPVFSQKHSSNRNIYYQFNYDELVAGFAIKI